MTNNFFKNLILRPLQKCEKCQGGALNLSQAKPAPKQINLNKLIDAGGSQIQWQLDAGRFALLERVQYTFDSFKKVEYDARLLNWRSVMMKPLGNRVLIKRAEAKTTKGGILLPDSAKEKPKIGEVVAVGPGKTDE